MTLTEAVKATYAVVGQEITDLQLAVTVEELSSYQVESVLAALSRCRKELRRVTLADILDRLPGGHPGPEAAWALISRCMKNEQISITWTDEMREAYGVAAPLADDPVAARMAFKESYLKLVNEARSRSEKPSWSVSLGHDPLLRQEAIEEAVRNNQISVSHAARLLPPGTMIDEKVKQITEQIGN